MIAPKRPDDESKRLQALRDLEILDTPHEERFDRISRLASRVMNMPIAVIGLVDEDREWFKSTCGISDSEGARETSFCGHTILSDEPFIVPNCLEDPRFADNPQVTGPSAIRSYAGVPLHAPGGERVGVLCVKDRNVREFAEEEIEMLRDLGNITEHELAHLETKELLRRKQEAEEDRDYYFKVSTDLLTVAGFDGYFKELNPSWTRTLGWTREELLAKPFLDFVHPDDREKTIAELERIDGDGMAVDFVNRYACRNGSYRSLHWTAYSIKRKGLIYASARDITEMEQSKQELQDFAFVASHDLQEPLRKVQAFGDRLMTQYGDALDDRGRDYLTRMQGAANRMQALIQGLLSYSRVTTRADAFKPVSIARLIEEVSSDLTVRLESSGGKLEVGEMPTLSVDEVQMRQLFQNLIGNALKFNRDGVSPHVKVRCEPTGDSPFTVIVVEDNGIGFDPSYTDRIFGVFQRLHGRGRYEGTGLGLAVCKRIVERHSGTIDAESVPGEGSRFIVRLPKSEVEEATA